MKRYVIERDIPAIGAASPKDLQGAAKTSNAAIAKVGGVKWELSFVTGDKTFCIYLASGKEVVLAHAKESGFPANVITEVTQIITPETAAGVLFSSPKEAVGGEGEMLQTS